MIKIPGSKVITFSSFYCTCNIFIFRVNICDRSNLCLPSFEFDESATSSILSDFQNLKVCANFFMLRPMLYEVFLSRIFRKCTWKYSFCWVLQFLNAIGIFILCKFVYFWVPDSRTRRVCINIDDVLKIIVHLICGKFCKQCCCCCGCCYFCCCLCCCQSRCTDMCSQYDSLNKFVETISFVV